MSFSCFRTVSRTSRALSWSPSSGSSSLDSFILFLYLSWPWHFWWVLVSYFAENLSNWVSPSDVLSWLEGGYTFLTKILQVTYCPHHIVLELELPTYWECRFWSPGWGVVCCISTVKLFFFILHLKLIEWRRHLNNTPMSFSLKFLPSHIDIHRWVLSAIDINHCGVGQMVIFEFPFTFALINWNSFIKKRCPISTIFLFIQVFVSVGDVWLFILLYGL